MSAPEQPMGATLADPFARIRQEERERAALTLVHSEFPNLNRLGKDREYHALAEWIDARAADIRAGRISPRAPAIRQDQPATATPPTQPEGERKCGLCMTFPAKALSLCESCREGLEKFRREEGIAAPTPEKETPAPRTESRVPCEACSEAYLGRERERDEAEARVEQYRDEIRNHLPRWGYDDGENDEATELERIAYTAEHLREVTAERDAALKARDEARRRAEQMGNSARQYEAESSALREERDRLRAEWKVTIDDWGQERKEHEAQVATLTAELERFGPRRDEYELVGEMRREWARANAAEARASALKGALVSVFGCEKCGECKRRAGAALSSLPSEPAPTRIDLSAPAQDYAGEALGLEPAPQPSEPEVRFYSSDHAGTDYREIKSSEPEGRCAASYEETACDLKEGHSDKHSGILHPGAVGEGRVYWADPIAAPPPPAKAEGARFVDAATSTFEVVRESRETFESYVEESMAIARDRALEEAAQGCRDYAREARAAAGHSPSARAKGNIEAAEQLADLIFTLKSAPPSAPPQDAHEGCRKREHELREALLDAHEPHSEACDKWANREAECNCGVLSLLRATSPTSTKPRKEGGQ